MKRRFYEFDPRTMHGFDWVGLVVGLTILVLGSVACAAFAIGATTLGALIAGA